MQLCVTFNWLRDRIRVLRCGTWRVLTAAFQVPGLGGYSMYLSHSPILVTWHTNKTGHTHCIIILPAAWHDRHDIHNDLHDSDEWSLRNHMFIIHPASFQLTSTLCCEGNTIYIALTYEVMTTNSRRCYQSARKHECYTGGRGLSTVQVNL